MSGLDVHPVMLNQRCLDTATTEADQVAVAMVELRQLVVEVWRTAVPKRVAAARLGERPPL
jgi:hypothetical protein